MAAFVLKDCSLVCNSVDLSDHVTEVKVEQSTSIVDVTAMGSTNKVYATGIGDGTITATFIQDFATGKVDATLNGLAGGASSFTVVVMPVKTGGVGATNPKYTMTAILPNYTPLSGNLNSAATTQVVFQNAASTGIVRATS